MAHFIENTTTCPLCGRVIQKGESYRSFPAMVWNQADNLASVSDATAHVKCLETSGLAEAAEARAKMVLEATGPGKRQCRICGQQVTSLDEHIQFGYLTDDAESPLFNLNLAHFHRSCLRRSEALPGIISALTDYQATGKWEGPWLSSFVGDLEALVDISQ